MPIFSFAHFPTDLNISHHSFPQISQDLSRVPWPLIDYSHLIAAEITLLSIFHVSEYMHMTKKAVFLPLNTIIMLPRSVQQQLNGHLYLCGGRIETSSEEISDFRCENQTKIQHDRKHVHQIRTFISIWRMTKNNHDNWRRCENHDFSFSVMPCTTSLALVYFEGRPACTLKDLREKFRSVYVVKGVRSLLTDLLFVRQALLSRKRVPMQEWHWCKNFIYIIYYICPPDVSRQIRPWEK